MRLFSRRQAEFHWWAALGLIWAPVARTQLAIRRLADAAGRAVIQPNRDRMVSLLSDTRLFTHLYSKWALVLQLLFVGGQSCWRVWTAPCGLTCRTSCRGIPPPDRRALGCLRRGWSAAPWRRNGVWGWRQADGWPWTAAGLWPRVPGSSRWRPAQPAHKQEDFSANHVESVQTSASKLSKRDRN